MNLRFRWQPGDVVAVGDRKSTQYYIIIGTTKIEDQQRYPRYVVKKFGLSKNGTFTGYHTKAFQSRARRMFDDDLWFEGMQYLWNVAKLNPSKFIGAKKKAYEAAVEGVTYDWETYQQAQIIYIFKESRSLR